MNTHSSIEKYYNTAVALVDLAKLRKHQSWQQEIADVIAIAHAQLSTMTSEVVFNAMIENHRSMFHTLPCSYNYHVNYCVATGQNDSQNVLHANTTLARQLCTGAEHGVVILQGDGTTFTTDDNFTKHLFDAYKYLNLQVHNKQMLRDLIMRLIMFNHSAKCANVADIFHKRLSIQ